MPNLKSTALVKYHDQGRRVKKTKLRIKEFKEFITKTNISFIKLKKYFE